MEERQRRSFTDDYKRQAVDLVASSGRSIGSVAKELGPCCIVPAVDELRLERVKEAVHRSIVIAVALAAHRRPEAGGLHQLDTDTRAAITPAGVAVDPPDVVDEVTIGSRSSALRARAPGIIAGRRDAKHVAQQRNRIIGTAIFDEAESHVRVPAKIAIDFFKMSRSMRSRSFSRCKRAISAAWSADGGVACVVGRRVAAVGSRDQEP